MTLALILLATLVSGLVSVLFAAQIEFCDVIVVNKADLVPEAGLTRLASILHTLNPRAKIEIARFGRVPLDRVLDTGLFDFGAASQAPGWLKEMRGEHVPETEEYGISSVVYIARRPFHPQRFWGLIHSEWEGVMRSKGYFRLASRPNSRGTGAGPAAPAGTARPATGGMPYRRRTGRRMMPTARRLPTNRKASGVTGGGNWYSSAWA